jgi:[amino group carrier protein]-L-2-aminoadipate 6-kinase
MSVAVGSLPDYCPGRTGDMVEPWPPARFAPEVSGPGDTMSLSRVTVIKWGGAIGGDPSRVCTDLATLVAGGARIVVVLGGSAAVDRLARRLGVPQQQIRSPAGVAARHTNAATLEVLQLALLGQVQPALLTELGRRGVTAIGLSGLDAGLLRARRKTAVRSVVDGRVRVVRDDHSGQIIGVNGELLRALLVLGITPIVCPPALCEDGRPVNSNADSVAAAIAIELAARRLIFLTAAAGLLADPADDASLVSQYSLPHGTGPLPAAESLPAAATAPPGAGRVPSAHGGMTVKLIAARDALNSGVPEVVIADGRTESPVSRALAGAGTRIRLRPAGTTPGGQTCG